MREILFRGRDINRNWHTGLLSISQRLDGQPNKGYYISNSCGMPWAYSIDPETVGQFTGLCDKNGKKIFENDIYHQGDKKILYVVEWIDSGLRGRQIKNKSWCGLEYWKSDIEIIGNIYNNPEFAK